MYGITDRLDMGLRELNRTWGRGYENSQSLDRAIDVAKAFYRSTNVNSSDY